METITHKALHYLQDAWPLISGLLLTAFAVARLWWHSRREIKNRIKNLEIIAEHAVTKEQLHSCREDVRGVDEKNFELISDKIDRMVADNHDQHQQIILRLTEPRGD